LNRVIEQIVGCDVHEIHSLYGSSAYRRYEQRALEETISAHPQAVIATGGGMVSEPATFELLLAHCYTVWLRASPEEHMQRVVAQGDLRPMAGSPEAMDGRPHFRYRRQAAGGSLSRTPGKRAAACPSASMKTGASKCSIAPFQRQLMHYYAFHWSDPNRSDIPEHAHVR
jgi:hypothetical protein